MSTPNTYYGRDARFYKGSTVVAHSTSLSLDASAQVIKIRSNDSLQPVKQKVGEQTFTLSCERLFTGPALLQDFIAGSSFDIGFAPDGDDDGDDVETWTSCVITKIGRKTAEGVVENLMFEATGVTFPA